MKGWVGSFICLLPLISLGENALGQIASHIVVSEVYGGGGNQGALYKNDFIELYNPTSGSVDLTGWSVQYASATGSGSWHSALLKGQIPAYGYYLIKLAGGSNGIPLPQCDTTGTINLSASSGKVALVSSTVLLSGANPSDSEIVDKVGYGNADGYEGSGPAPSPSATISIERKARPTSTASSMAPGGVDQPSGNGWDSNDNAMDFVAQKSLSPQNSASAPEEPPNDIFPATIGSFTATPIGQTVVLTWSTISERGAYGFEVQKSLTSAEGYTSISGLIPGHGTSTIVHYYSFIDTMREPGHFYRLREVDTNGVFFFSEPIDAPAIATVRSGFWQAHADLQNYPNPFKPGTVINYRIAVLSNVRLTIYDILGREVTVLVEGKQNPGSYSVAWNPMAAAPGVYFCRLRTESSVQTTRLVLLR